MKCKKIFFLKIVKIFPAELPWRECNNDWNTETCRNPYEKPFNESCKMSDAKFPCSEVGAKYGDCEVGWFSFCCEESRILISIFRNIILTVYAALSKVFWIKLKILIWLYVILYLLIKCPSYMNNTRYSLPYT